MIDKTPEELEVERVASEAAAADAETARLASEEAARLAAEGKTPEELEAERVAAEKAKVEAPKPDWRDERLATTTAQKKALAERLAKYETPDGKPVTVPAVGDTPAALTQADVDRLAGEKAVALAARADFDARANATAKEGQKLYPDFMARVGELVKVVDKSDPASRKAYDDFLEAAMETGEAPKLIYELGGDLNEAVRIMSLSPTKRAIELTQRALGIDTGPSSMPKPMTTVQGKNSGPSEIAASDPVRADKLSSAEWHKRRNAELAKNTEPFARRQSGR